MRASGAEANQNEERLKEYHRQQERLKAITTGSEKIKSMSADVMIENLLKQNFAKPSVTHTDCKIGSHPGIPHWLNCESSDLPVAYNQLWSLVKTPTTIFADTQKVSQLLLTSGLPTEVLGFIWNICNRAVPGQLNKQEFCTVLALVGLVQSGYTFNNLSILNMVPAPPIPALQPKVLEKFGKPFTMLPNSHNQIAHVKISKDESFKTVQPVTATYGEKHFFHAPPPVPNEAQIQANDQGRESVDIRHRMTNSKEVFDSDNGDIPKTSKFPIIGSSPTAELEDEDDFSEFHSVTMTDPVTEVKSFKDNVAVSHTDEFTDFQCADIAADQLETVVISQKKEIPKIPLPKNLSGKLSSLRTNILKISPESEKKLKMLTQSEALSTLPESKISTNNKVSTMPNISVLSGSRDVGMRLASHSLGSKSERKHQRMKHKPLSHSEEMVFPPKYSTIEELFPKCFQKSPCGSKTFVLKETKISSVELTESESSAKFDNDSILEIPESIPGKNTRTIEIPMLGIFTETTLPTQSEIASTAETKTLELFSMEEDKYSALREVQLEMSSETRNAAEERNTTLEAGDDFGEFLSADIPQPPAIQEADLWGEWCDPEPASQRNDATPDVQAHSETAHFKTRNGDFATTAFSIDLLTLSEGDAFVTPSAVEHERSNQSKTADACTKEIEGDLFAFVSEVVPPGTEGEPGNRESKATSQYEDFLVVDGRGGNEEGRLEGVVTSETDADEDFGEFFTPNFEASLVAEDMLGCSRETLPSLDLKTPAQDGNNQESIRNRCLTACLNMIQQGLDIFNGVSSKMVLDEVFSTAEAASYLNNLNIISQIARRVSINYRDVSCVHEDIERTWEKLVSYCNEYKIVLKESEEWEVGVGLQRCNLCLGSVGHDVIDQGMTLYHPTCANFWVNCVESQLPPCPV